MTCRTGLGRATRRFLPPDSTKSCVIGGVTFDDVPGLAAESDGDVVYHAICSALSTLTGEQILNDVAEEMLQKDGITESETYLRKGMEFLRGQQVTHVALQIEAMRPLVRPMYNQIRANVAEVMGLSMEQVGVSAISGEGLTDFGCGDGILCQALVTTEES